MLAVVLCLFLRALLFSANKERNNNSNSNKNIRFNGQFPSNLGKPVTECQTILDFDASKDDGGGSGDRWNAKITILQAGRPSCRHTNVSKH